ncbi:MAG: hypothetical protein P1V97_09260 [Planctomycetota bacterium]|nr:hypothetical protein [Planctomycetota bacterium]
MNPDSNPLNDASKSEANPKNQSSIVVLGCFVFLILSVCLLLGGGSFLAFTFFGEKQRLAENDTIEIQKKMLAAEARAQQNKALKEKIRRTQEAQLKAEIKRKIEEEKTLKATRRKEAKALAEAAKAAKLGDSEEKRAARDAERQKQLDLRNKQESAVEAQRSLVKVAQQNGKLGQLPRLGVSEAQQAEISKRVTQLLTDYMNKKASYSKLKRVLLILDKIVLTQSFSEQAYQELDAELERS